MVAQESRRDVQILLMHELDASKQAAAGIGKIPIDFSLWGRSCSFVG